MISDEFSEKEIIRKRRALAKSWRQKLAQVTDYEAIHYLRKDRDALLTAEEKNEITN